MTNPLQESSLRERAREEILQSLPIEFFATHDYHGKDNELEFTMWKDVETKRCLGKQDVVLRLLDSFITTAQEEMKQRCLSALPDKDTDIRADGTRASLEPFEYHELTGWNNYERAVRQAITNLIV
jgi:hypothetical protein